MILETDEIPMGVEFSNAEGKGMALATAGLATAGTIGAALAGRQKTFSEVEQKCGKKPKFKGKKLNAWNDCAKSFASSSTPMPTATPVIETKKTKVPTWAWVVGGVAVLGIVGLIVYKTKK